MFNAIVVKEILASSIALFCCSLVAAHAPDPLANSRAAIQGIIVDQAGNRLSSVTFRYARVPQYLATIGPAGTQRLVEDRTQPAVSAVAATDSNGMFTITQLPPGDYLLCAGLNMPGYLDGCRWSPVIEVNALTANDVRTVPQIRLSKGAIVNIRVNDLLGVLPRGEDPIMGSGVAVGIIPATGGYFRADITTIDSSGLTYQITVPFDTPLNLWVFSRSVLITDETGSEINTNGQVRPVRFSSATPVSTFTFNTVGTR